MDLVRIDGRYRLGGRIGFGSYGKSLTTTSHPLFLTQNNLGEIYLARDVLSGQDVAIKLEPVEEKRHTLEHEFNVYLKLAGGTGIPCVYWFGTETGFNAMAISRLGQSLDKHFVLCKFRFSVNTVLQLASQLVRSDLFRAKTFQN
jgi:predicted Ser/Thr protein kinase